MPPGTKFQQKVPPKRRVIATKLNLRQKCVNHFFHHFSLFFLVFHGFSSFCLFFVIFHHTKFIPIQNWNRYFRPVSSSVYSTKFCMFNSLCELFGFGKLCLFSFYSYQNIAIANETCVLRINFVLFWGAHLSQNVWGGTNQNVWGGTFKSNVWQNPQMCPLNV